MTQTLALPRTMNPDIDVNEHFNASARLYREWSPEGHLHFGYYRVGACPLTRRHQLEAMVDETVAPMNPAKGKRFADLGCGYGSAAVHIASKTGADVDGFTIIDEQVKSGSKAKQLAGVDKEVKLHCRDFRKTEMPDEHYDGAYALESICYGTDENKEDVLREVYRILKPGAKLGMVDGFIIKQPRKGGIRNAIMQRVSRGWAVDTFAQIDAFKDALQHVGFKNIEIKDLSFRVAPSAFHAPPLIVKSIAKRLLLLDPMSRGEIAHLISCFWGLVLGMFRPNFRYLQVTAEKRMENISMEE